MTVTVVDAASFGQPEWDALTAWHAAVRNGAHAWDTTVPRHRFRHTTPKVGATPLWRVCDLSNWQPGPATGIIADNDACICQIGVPWFAEHAAEAQRQAKPLGAYVWCYPGRPVDEELARYTTLLAPHLDTLSIRTSIDVEETPGLANPTAGQTCSWLAYWFEQRAGDLLYTSPGEWHLMTGGSRLFGAERLWVAGYGVAQPGLPAGWNTWAAWQYTSSPYDRSLMDPTQVLIDTSPGGVVGKFGITHGIVDPSTPPDSKGRIPWWGVDVHGNIFNWNGARPVAGLGSQRVNRDDICGAQHVDASAWYPEGLVLLADDGAPDGSEWAASTFHLPVPAPAAHTERPGGRIPRNLTLEQDRPTVRPARARHG